MTTLNFDASKVAPAVAYEAIPAGWYTAHIISSNVKPTQDGTGAYLNLEFEILGPAGFEKRKLFDRLNLHNTNAVAVEIAYRTLSAICHATGVIQVADSAALHNRPLELKVSLRPAGLGANGQNYEASNEIKGYRAVQAQAAIPAAPAFTPPPAAPAAPAFVPPAAPAAAPVFTPPAPPAAAPAAPAPAESAALPPWATATPAAAPAAPAAPVPAAAAPVPVGGAPVPPWLQQQPA